MKNVRRSSDVREAAAILFLLCLCAAPGYLFAHAYPDHADPRVGSTIAAAPGRVRVWFDSELEPLFSAIVVQDAAGKKVDKGDGRVDPADPTLLEVSLPPLPPGTYRVLWDVVARDTHRTRGDFTFIIK